MRCPAQVGTSFRLLNEKVMTLQLSPEEKRARIAALAKAKKDELDAYERRISLARPFKSIPALDTGVLPADRNRDTS